MELKNLTRNEVYENTGVGLKNEKKFKKLYLYAIRIILNFCSIICAYYAYRNLPIAISTSISMTYPLFVTILLKIVLQHKVSFYKWLIISLGYIGVLILVKPTTFLLDYNSILAILIGLLASIFTATTIIIIKVLTREDNTVKILLFNNLGIAILASLFSTQQWQPVSIQDIRLLFLVGILDTAARFCFAKALEHSNPIFVVPFEYTRIPFSILVGWVVFNEIPVFIKNLK